MKRYITSIIGIGVLYLLNRFCLISWTTGVIHNLLAWHGADFLAGALMLCVLNAALIAYGRQPLKHLLWVTLFLLACGLFWEVITPIYLPRSVSDPQDVLACWLGGNSFLLLERTIDSLREF